MRAIHLLTTGQIGGIERLCLDIGSYSNVENGFCFLSHGGAMMEQMVSKGLKTYDLSSLGGKFSTKKYRQLKAIAAQYDCIVVHHGDPFLKLYFVLLKTLRKKMVTVVHSCFDGTSTKKYGKVKKKVHHAIFQLAFSVADAVVFVSNAGKISYQKSFRIPEHKCTVIYNGVSLDKINRGRENRVSTEPPYAITYVGRLNAVKGVDLLINAVSQLRSQWDVQLHLVGDGPDRAHLESLSQQKNASEYIFFHGQQLDVEPFLMNAATFVYPSRWQEVFGISIVEAMAFGIPCVASNVGGIPEVIENGVSGYLFELENVDDLSAKLEQILALLAAGQAEALSKQAKKRAETFSILNTVQKLENLYKQLMG